MTDVTGGNHHRGQIPNGRIPSQDHRGAPLAVALWLDDQGVTGLSALMEGLAVSYQAERPELETGDLTALVVRALLRCAAATGDTSDTASGTESASLCETNEFDIRPESHILTSSGNGIRQH